MKILEHHDGEFWTLSRTARQRASFTAAPRNGTRLRSSSGPVSARCIFDNVIPDPRDVIIIALVEHAATSCGSCSSMDEEHGGAHRAHLPAGPDCPGDCRCRWPTALPARLLRRATPSPRQIPQGPAAQAHVRNRNASASGNLPALFADLAERVRPRIQSCNPPFVEHHDLPGRARDQSLGSPPGAHAPARQGLPQRLRENLRRLRNPARSLDGADHFRFRKALQPGYSRARLEGQLDSRLPRHPRAHGDLECRRRPIRACPSFAGR